ncbi:MAG TPA: sialate O-acetylesterase [Polyangiaceae bacterium]|nr:sialate O-acetylesterase [Polyangiaceae bacterium]
MREVFQSLGFVTVLVLGSAACESGSNAAPEQSAAPPSGADAPAAGSTPDNGDESGGDEAAGAMPSEAPTTPGSGNETSPSVNGGVAPSGADTDTAGASDVDQAAGADSEGADSEGTQPDAVQPSDTPSTPTFHVFLLLGQSNMAGYPKAQPADRTEDPRVKVLGFDNCAGTGRVTDQWDVAAPPLHECWNDGLGPGDYFAKTLLDVIPAGDSIGLVPCAISGERIEPFLKVGGTRYGDIMRRARLAQEAGGKIEGFLFHQGESNTGDPTWPGKVNTLVTDLRADLALGDVPFLAGELLYTGGSARHNVLVNQLPSVVSNAFVISANGLVVDPADTQWNLHFGHDSVVEFGKRYAQTMIQALGW